MNIKIFQRKSAYNAEKQNKKDNFTFLNERYCKKNQTVLAGDSITEICNMELFNKYIENSGTLVYNRGISGDTSDRLLERFEDNVLKLNPKNLVIMIGTNDLSINATTTYIADNVEQMIKLTKSKSPETNIILQSVYPVDVKQSKKNVKICELNILLMELAAKYKTIYLDVYTLLSDDNGGINPCYTYDGLHPNAYGFEIAVNEIVSMLK
jgi:lysophospholipase L1-like esterase